VAEVALAPLGLFPKARPLTLDLPATAGEVAKTAALLAAAAAAVLLSATRESRDALVGAVSGAGVTAVVVLVVRAALRGAPLLASGGSFVNENHLAALLALAAWPALGRAMREVGRARAAWLAVFAVTGGGIFLTLSRGGIVSFFVGAAVFAALHARREAASDAQRAPGTRWLRHAALPMATALALAVAAYAGMERLGDELRSLSRVESDPRMEVWPSAVELIRKYPLTGVGRGAFAVAFAGHQRASAIPLTYTYAENEWLQLPLDLGVPIGAGLLAALAWAWLSAARRRDLSRVEVGALAATAAVATHALVDFALELLGVALPFVVLLGALQARSGGVSLRPIVFRTAAIALAVAGSAGLSFAARHPPEEPDALVHAGTADVGARAHALAALRPADFLPHAIAGARLVEAGRCAEALPWLVRAMWLAPAMPGSHRYTARCLADAGQDAFARREYRLAFTLGDGAALDEAVPRWSGAASLLELVPETSPALGKLAATLDRLERRAEATEVLRSGWERLSDPDLLFRLGQVTSAHGDQARALELARELRTHEPHRARSYVLAAEVLARVPDRDGAVRELEDGLARLPGSSELVLAMAAHLVREKRFAQAVQHLAAHPWRSAEDAARARDIRIRALRAQGRLPEAVAEARTARELDSSNVAVNLRLADLLAQAGHVDEAIGVLAGAGSLPAADPKVIAERLERIRASSRRRHGPTPGVDEAP
jgi:tetratricopeptide (TPR) repeat protein